MKTPHSPWAGLVAATCLAAAPCLCLAQDAEQVAVRAALVTVGGASEELALFSEDADSSLSITVGPTGFSPETKLPRMELWRFGHWQSEGGEKSFEELGRVVPPEGKKLWLVIERNKPAEDAESAGSDESDAPEDEELSVESEIVEDHEASEAPETLETSDGPPDEGAEAEEAEPVLSIYAVNADDSALGEGGVVILNLAADPITVDLDGEAWEIEPEGSESIQPKAEKGARYPVKVFAMQRGMKRPFVTTNWFFGEKRRRLAVAVQPEGAAVPKLVIVDEIAAGAE